MIWIYQIYALFHYTTLFRSNHSFEPRARFDRRVCVRPAEVPRSRSALHARARDADDPGPAAARPDLPDARQLDSGVGRARWLARRELRQPRWGDPDPARLGDESLPDASVLSHDSAGPRGGREARRCGLLQDISKGDAAPGRAGARGGRDSHVPGHLECALLARSVVAGQVAVHDSNRHRELPLRVSNAVAAAHGCERPRDRADPLDLHPLPAVLRRGRRRGRGEGMTLRRALGVAASDLYHQAWRLIALNVILGGVVIAV